MSQFVNVSRSVYAASQRQQRSAAPDFSKIIEQYRTAQAKANQANLQRYQQGLSTLRAGHATATAQAQQFGTSALQDIEESSVQQRARGEQELTSRGLGGTTIRGAMTRGVERERLRGRARVGEQRATMLGQLAQRQGAEIAGFMERRTDTGPDLGMFANLLQAAGQQQQQPRATITRMGPMAAAGLTGTGTRGFVSQHRAEQQASAVREQKAKASRRSIWD